MANFKVYGFVTFRCSCEVDAESAEDALQMASTGGDWEFWQFGDPRDLSVETDGDAD